MRTTHIPLATISTPAQARQASTLRPCRVLSLIPPMTQLNTPYPATAYLTGFLREQTAAPLLSATQADLALGLVLRLFSPEGLAAMQAAALAQKASERSASSAYFLAQYTDYQSCLAPTLRFVQGKDASLAHRIASRTFLPEGPRFEAIEAQLLALGQAAEDKEDEDPLAWAFGALGVQDKARHIATLFLNDIADVLRHTLDARFEFVRYAESLSSSQASFDGLQAALDSPPSYVDTALAQLTDAVLAQHFAHTAEPSLALLLLSIPFPGALYGALRIAQRVKTTHPHIRILLGGGYVNTELRKLSEPRLFDYVDFVCLDAGERPLLQLIAHLRGECAQDALLRTYVRENGQVRYIAGNAPDIPFSAIGTPTWDGLPLQDYLSLLDMLNPMHRLWSDGRWNKLTIAHGCYWKKCSFCDVSLDYIARYETASAELLVDRIERIIAQTGHTGFHFVDEAAPPKALKALAQELLRRRVIITWWGNIRFEKTFDADLCALLAQSGCIAMSGGLEVASDRLLALMQKGVTVEQVAQVTQNLAQNGILVHAYLMYGFPTQTVQETVDALEYVRQLFLNGCIHSGYFHRFTCTVHSPVGLNPAAYGIRLRPLPTGGFAQNDVGFIDPTNVDHTALGTALRKAIYNFMHGIGLEDDVRGWFAHLNTTVPKTRVHKRFIAKALA